MSRKPEPVDEKLAEYRRRRDFDTTPEPDQESAEHAPAGNRFVIHKHAARNLHFDLRLEVDGVLRSWALPKGPSIHNGEKRLAVEVEDHPLAYAEFEGNIPKGAYGGGTIMLWDRGLWSTLKPITEDRIDFVLAGKRLAGHWTLTRLDDDKHRNWLLIKRKPRAGENDTARAPDDADRSVRSNRTMTQIRQDLPTADADRSALAPGVATDLAAMDGARQAALPNTVRPQLASNAKRAPAGDDWLHEIKLDGYRLLARVDGADVRLFTRSGHDWSERFEPLCHALARHLQHAVFLDGELVALDAAGRSRFGALQDAIATARTQTLVYQLFDVLHVDQTDLRGVALASRKTVLKDLLEGAPPGLRYTDHIVGRGRAFFREASAAGLEGILSKRTDSRYRPGRQNSWRKTKTEADDTFVIGGFTAGAGQRDGAFGALLLGEPSATGLRYVGRVGTGFSDRQLEAIGGRLAELSRDISPFNEAVADTDTVSWVEPRLLADVAFSERTGGGLLRQARFRGLRDDLPAPAESSEVSANHADDSVPQPAPTPEPVADDSMPSHLPLGNGRSSGRRVIQVAGVRLTHPDRLVYDDPPVSKQAFAEYIEATADWMLRGLANRPLSLLRCPDGIAKACFFQKHPRSAVPESVPRMELFENDHERTGVYTFVRKARDLIALVQAGTVEIHPWSARIDNVERPDQLIFDIDPGPDTDWLRICDVAQALRARIEQLGLVPFLRLTGGRGVHLVAPIERRLSWDEAKAFTRAVCRAHARKDPKHTTTEFSKAARRGRLFLDYLRNARGATAIASYCPRARAGAGVSMNLRWDELAADRRSDHYDLTRARQRLIALKDDPWSEFDSSRRRVTQSMWAALESGKKHKG